MFGKTTQGAFQRLKTLKLQMAYLILALVCIFFYWIDSKGSALPDWVPRFPPYKSLAEACLTALMISFIYEGWIRRENQAELHESILSPTTIKSVVSDRVAEEITKAAFQRMLGSDEFGEELFEYFTDFSFSETRRRYDLRNELTLLPLLAGSNFNYSIEQERTYFTLRSSLSYRKPIRTTEIWFRCVSEVDDLRSVLADQSVEWRWHVSQHPNFPRIDESFFAVSELEIDGRPMRIHKSEESGKVSYFAKIPRDIRKKEYVRIRFKVDVKVRKAAHRIFTDIVHPVKDLVISFDVSSVPEVTEVGVVPIFSSVARPKHDYFPTKLSPKKITVAVDGWSIPDSGVTFVWRRGESD